MCTHRKFQEDCIDHWDFLAWSASLDVARCREHVLQFGLGEAPQHMIRKDAHALRRKVVAIDRRHPVEKQGPPSCGGEHGESVVCKGIGQNNEFMRVRQLSFSVASNIAGSSTGGGAHV